jgi:hypothetical protein
MDPHFTPTFVFMAQVSGQLHAPADLPPGKSTHWIGGWVDHRAGLDDVEKVSDPTETRLPTPRSSSPWPVAIPTALPRSSAVCITVPYV